jgi:hypothetical protein
LDSDLLLEMQRALHDYIRVLYSKGITYQVKPEYLFPVKMGSGRWIQSSFHPAPQIQFPDKSQTQPVEWKRREETQCDEIKRIFAEARAAITTQYD